MPTLQEKIRALTPERREELQGYPFTREGLQDVWTAYKGFRARKTEEGKEAWRLMGRLDLSDEEQDKVNNFILESMDFGGAAGVIKRGSRAVGRGLRETMAKEFKARGPAFKAPGPPTREQQVDELLDASLSSVFFHGRRTYPVPGETFGRSRISGTNLGEPTGLSLSLGPEVGGKFGKPRLVAGRAMTKLQEKRSQLITEREQAFDASGLGAFTSKVARDPTSTRKQLNTAYELAQDLRKEFHRQSPLTKRIEGLEEGIYKLKLQEGEGVPFARVFPRAGGPGRERIIAGFKSAGTERHQQILKEVYAEAAEPIIRRSLPPGTLESRLSTFYTSGQTAHSRDVIARNIIKGELEKSSKLFNEALTAGLKKRGFKGILYSPARFGERELKMFEPGDVTMLDLRQVGDLGIERLVTGRGSFGAGPPRLEGATGLMGSQGRKIAELEEFVGADPYSLRDIYKEVDLPGLHRKIVGLGEVKPPILAKELKHRFSLADDIATIDAALKEMGPGALADFNETVTQNQLLTQSAQKAYSKALKNVKAKKWEGVLSDYDKMTPVEKAEADANFLKAIKKVSAAKKKQGVSKTGEEFDQLDIDEIMAKEGFE